MSSTGSKTKAPAKASAPAKAAAPAKVPATTGAPPASNAKAKPSEAKVAKLARYGWHTLALGDTAAGLTALQAVVELAPERADYWSAYSIALAKGNRHIDACHALNRAVGLNPKDIDAWCVLSELLLGLHDYKNATAAFRKVLALDPGGTHPSGVRVRALIRKADKQLKADSRS